LKQEDEAKIEIYERRKSENEMRLRMNRNLLAMVDNQVLRFSVGVKLNLNFHHKKANEVQPS